MIKIFKKDLKLFLKDKRAVLLTFLLPIILISLFAFAFGGIKSNNSKPKPIPLLITDLDKSQSTEQIITKLDSLKGIEFTQMDLDKSKNQVTKGNYAGVLVFYKGFQDSLTNGHGLPIELLYDKAREMQIGLLQPLLINALMKLNVQESLHRNVAGFLRTNFPSMDKSMSNKIMKDIGENFQKSDNSKDTGTQLKMTSIVGEKKDTNLFLIQAIAGVAIMMLLFSVSGLAAGMLDEKESGTLKRLLYSPLKPNAILFGKMLTALTVSISQLTIMFVFAWMAFGLDITKNIPALILMVLSTAFAVSGIGIFLAAISKTRAQAQGLDTLVILTMSAIGGSMIPLFIMPAIMQKIAVISINYWGIQGFYDIFWRELPTIDILPRILVLLGMGLTLMLISIRLFNRNIEKLA